MDAEEARDTAAVLRPDASMSRISAFCSGDNWAVVPPLRPRLLAACRPALVRSRTMARSNSAKAPSICTSMRPAGPAVSTASVSERNPAPAASIRSRRWRRSLSERDSRSSFQPRRHRPRGADRAGGAARAIPPSAGSLLLEHAPAPGGLERVDLGGGVLMVGLGDAGVAEKHGDCRANLLPLGRIWQQVCRGARPCSCSAAASGAQTVVCAAARARDAPTNRMDDTSVPRRTVLTDAQRAALLAIPTDETTLVRHYTLSDEDRRLITRRRRPDTRLGLALQLCALRYPGRLLRPGEPIPMEAAGFIAGQLDVSPEALGDFARRNSTRYEQLGALRQTYGFVDLTHPHRQELRGWLLGVALVTTDGVAVVAALAEEMRRRRIVIPGVTVLERLAAEVISTADDQVIKSIVGRLRLEQRRRLDMLCEQKAHERQSRFAWVLAARRCRRRVVPRARRPPRGGSRHRAGSGDPRRCAAGPAPAVRSGRPPVQRPGLAQDAAVPALRCPRCHLAGGRARSHRCGDRDGRYPARPGDGRGQTPT